MSRKYLNDKWCVRCGKTEPTPYLRDHAEQLLPESNEVGGRLRLNLLDLGCGNGRNWKYLHQTYWLSSIVPIDMVDSTGTRTDHDWGCILGHDLWPVPCASVDIVLANYVFMFLDRKERKQVYEELDRVTCQGSRIMVELYPAKDSHAKTDTSCNRLIHEILRGLGPHWSVLHRVKNRFIARRQV